VQEGDGGKRVVVLNSALVSQLQAGLRIRIVFNADSDTDPDPAFFLIANPDPGSGSRVS
jgi:hypothetical protein